MPYPNEKPVISKEKKKKAWAKHDKALAKYRAEKKAEKQKEARRKQLYFKSSQR